MIATPKHHLAQRYTKSPSLSDYHANVADHRIGKDGPLPKVRQTIKLVPGDYVYFWRDQFRWIGPARVAAIQEALSTSFATNGTKTADILRVRKTIVTFELMRLDDDSDSKRKQTLLYQTLINWNLKVIREPNQARTRSCHS